MLHLRDYLATPSMTEIPDLKPQTLCEYLQMVRQPCQQNATTSPTSSDEFFMLRHRKICQQQLAGDIMRDDTPRHRNLMEPIFAIRYRYYINSDFHFVSMTRPKRILNQPTSTMH
jgi:hypothetical protein